MIENLLTSVVSGFAGYPTIAPFDPAERFPESIHPDRPLDPANKVYGMVREALRLLGLDETQYGTPEWNPLGEIVRPGDSVLIKPNFVLHRNIGTGPFEAMVTHASVLRPIVDYVLIALQGRGRLVIGDAPQMNCDFETLLARNGMGALAPFVAKACQTRGVEFQLVDFRREQTYYRFGIVWKRRPLSGRDGKTIPVVLGPDSYMENIRTDLLYGADYDRRQTVAAHSGKHEYRVAAEVIQADVVISVPKLKTHSKVGTTLNIKNMVGINTDKNHLAHYRVGPPNVGGDEYSNPRWYDRVDRSLSDVLLGRHWKWGKYPFVLWRVFKKLVQAGSKSLSFSCGNWHGNDTAWRMALDLNRVLLCTDKDGELAGCPRRRYFSIIDGIVGGQGDGPLHPDAYRSGVILAGFNPVAVDWVATRLMGFDPERIPMYRHGIEQARRWIPDFSVSRLRVTTNDPRFKRVLDDAAEPVFRFAPSPGWRGTIERYSDGTAAPEESEPESAILQ